MIVEEKYKLEVPINEMCYTYFKESEINIISIE